MTQLAWIRLKTLVWFLCFPVTFIGVIPWWLNQRLDGWFIWSGGLWQWVGLWLILNGAGLAGWCVNLFNKEGRGTPLPLDPPKQFVATGPYRFVRNPMMLGVFLVLLGEAALYSSRIVLFYSGCLVMLAVLFVRCIEEPGLERRFGAAYTTYKTQVPRWIPRFSGAGSTKRR